MTRPYSPTELWDMANKRGMAVGPRPEEKKRKPRSNEESRAQREVIKWWRSACRRLNCPELALFSIPNGGWRGPVTGSILKAEGLRKGVPDLMLAVPKARTNSGGAGSIAQVSCCRTFGLFIEMKTATGRLLPEQEVYHELLQKQGYRVEVCRSAKEAANVIQDYLTS